MGWFVFLGLIALFGLVIAWRIWAGKRDAGFLALVEYWVYSDVQRMPPTAALMDAVVSKNPHSKPGRPSITAREGILFSDLRLHMAIARRDKNPHAFRPDLFEDHAVPDARVLEVLSSCRSLAKIQYASNVPLVDGRHLQFVTHLVDTVAKLTRGQLIFDTVNGQFLFPEELHKALQQNNDAERPDLHVRVFWEKTVEGCRAVTLGLRKVGRPELQTSLQEADQEVIIVTILNQVARMLFTDVSRKLPIQTRMHGDEFIVSEDFFKDGKMTVKIVRRLGD